MLTGLLVLFTVLLLWQFLGYPLFMSLMYRKHKKSLPDKDYSYQPFISIIVPAYNEEHMINQRIENLLSQAYPKDKFEVIVIDSGSTDTTLEIAKVFEKDEPNVRVLEEGERRGKASAINLGKSYAKGEIILVTDANTVFDVNVLREIAPHFRNLNIGAVGGRFVLSNVENELVRASSFYWELESLMRRGESALDSACLFHGEINAWRKDVVEADPGSLAEDLDMAIKIRKQGYKIVYEPDAIAYEPGPTTKKEQIVQKKRATIGTIQSFFKHKRYLWLPGDKYSGFIFPSHKTLQILSPYFLLGILATFSTLLVLQQFVPSTAYILAAGALFLLSLTILNKELSETRTIHDSVAKVALPSNLLNILLYVLLHEYIILLAWKDFVFGNYAVTWEKAESTRILKDL
ncbi:glycosyltransferase [Chloroflexota bacterium]